MVCGLKTSWPVSQIPETLVSLWFEAFNARDLDGVLAPLDREVDLYPLKLRGLAGSYRGHGGVQDWLADLEREDHDYQIDLGDVCSMIDGQVVALGSLRLAGELDVAPFCAVQRIGGGLIVAAHHCLRDPEMIDRLGLIP
jgi:SnoaL-like domain